MKTSTRISALAVAGIAAFSLTALPMAFADDGELSDAEIAGLIFSREEERLARDLYQAFSDQYDGARPFSKIVASEQRHFDAVGRLLTQYGIDDPAAGATAGSFSDATLQVSTTSGIPRHAVAAGRLPGGCRLGDARHRRP